MASPWRRPSAAERRREQEADLNPANGNLRPNEPPTPLADVDRCPGRVGGGHNFSSIVRGPEGFSDDRGPRVVRCWYCVQLSPFSQQRIAAWREKQGEG